jgi:hypothetical protein
MKRNNDEPNTSSASAPLWQKTVEDYETLVNEKLRVDLERVLDERDKIYELISE